MTWSKWAQVFSRWFSISNWSSLSSRAVVIFQGAFQWNTADLTLCWYIIVNTPYFVVISATSDSLGHMRGGYVVFFVIVTSDPWSIFVVELYNDGLVQERRKSSVLAMELRLSCTKLSIKYNCNNSHTYTHIHQYHKTSNTRYTKFPKLKWFPSHLELTLLNPLKSDIKSRMKM